MSATDDITAIRAGLDRYVWSVDTHDADRFVENFTEDGVYVSPFGSATGHGEIRASIEGWHGSGLTAGKRHLAGPAHIELDGDRATVESSYLVIEAATAPGIVASGGYVDTWVRSADGWRLARREQTVDPSFSFDEQG